MNWRNSALAFALIAGLVLTACGAEGTEGQESADGAEVSGVKSGVYTLSDLSRKMATVNRPSSMLGIFVSLYASQGTILPTMNAENGIEALKKLLEAQTRSDTDENFALLREVGGILQVNIVDTLNRSSERAKTLDEYTRALEKSIDLMERKLQELEVLYDAQKEETKELRSEIRDRERELKTALRDQDYGTASDIEEGLASMNSAYAEIDTKTDQTGDMIDRFEDLYDIAKSRYQAITNNREILIAGLRVIDVPGIKDLNILEKGTNWRRSRGSRIFN